MTEWTLDAVHANGEFSIKHILFPASSEAPMPRSRHDPETSVSPRGLTGHGEGALVKFGLQLDDGASNGWPHRDLRL